MSKVLEILNAYGQIGVDMVKQSLEQVRASGKTIESVKYDATQNNTRFRLLIKARPYTSAIEDGIRPSNKGIPPEMIKNLTEYAQIRGMEKPKSAAWAIAKTIKKKGDKTHRAGGREVYSDDVIKLVDEIKKEVRKDFRIQFTSFIKNTF